MQKFKDLIYYNRKEILIVLICLVSFSSFYLFTSKKSNYDEVEESVIEISDEKEEEKNSKIVIDIKGEVINPGTYELESNNRVQDAIDKAGGLTENADTNYINLSEKLLDEMIIIVPSKEDIKEEESTSIPKSNSTTITSSITKSSSSSKKSSTSNTSDNKTTSSGSKTNTIISTTQNSSNSVIKPGESTDSKISINTATIEELMTIKGIGETKAKAIVNYRNTVGLFKDIKDITNVSGIGNSTFEKIKDYIKV